MPEFVLNGRDSADFRDLPELLKGYIEAAFFTATRPQDVGNGVGDACPACGMILEEDESGAPYCPQWGCCWSCGEVPDSYGFFELAPKALETMRRDCEAFETANGAAIDACEHDTRQVGIDFWFTRNGHGGGFWDREAETDAGKDALDALDTAARAFRGVDLYRGDDGKVYLS
jgi:hypothetical protein